MKRYQAIKTGISLLSTAVMIMMLNSGCHSTGGVTPSETPAEPTMGDTMTPKPSLAPSTGSPAVTSSTAATSTPAPTATSYTSLFGVTEATRNTTINADDVQSLFFNVNSVEKAFQIKPASFINGVKSCNDLYTGELIGSLDEQNNMAINYSYFKTKFKDDNVNVKFLFSGNLKSILLQAKTLGYKVDESKLSEMTGEITYEQLEKWIVEVVPKPFWPILTDYILYQRTDSQIPRDRDSEVIGDKVLKAIVISYDDDTTKVVFAEEYKNDQGVYCYQNLFNKVFISDVKFKNKNVEFFNSIKSNGKIVDISSPAFKDFVTLPIAKKLSGALTNLKPTDTIGYLREAYEMLDDQYWYIPPRATEKGLSSNYGRTYLSTRDLAQPSIKDEIAQGLYTLKDLYKKPMTTDELVKSIMSDEQDSKDNQDLNVPKEKVLQSTNL